jgi:cytochrome c oxidase assembly protein subunit 19
MNFSGGKQTVLPPQKGVFPLDHENECKSKMREYLSCLRKNERKHQACKLLSKSYLSCRMDKELMAVEDLSRLGYGEHTKFEGVIREEEGVKETAGFIAGKHIQNRKPWFGLLGRSDSDAGK